MAQIGYCYGSEYQLLRFLGHHRHQLEQEISRVLGESGEFNWLDFDYADPMKVLSGDSEKTGLGFLKDILSEEVYHKINHEYNSYKINKLDSWQNWDAVFTLNGTVYLVEAKARVREISSDNKNNGGESKNEILRFMTDQLPALPVSEKWLGEYYQLANRLATTALINKYVPAKTLCVYFLNGYSKRVIVQRCSIQEVENLSACRKEDFEEAISKEMEALNITENQIKDLLASVYIDAAPHIY